MSTETPSHIQSPHPTATVITESSLRRVNSRKSHCCHRNPWNVISDHLNSTSKGAKSLLVRPNAFSVTPPWSYPTSFCSGLETALPSHFQHSSKSLWMVLPPNSSPPPPPRVLAGWHGIRRKVPTSTGTFLNGSSKEYSSNSHQATSCTKQERRCLPVVCYNPGQSEHSIWKVRAQNSHNNAINCYTLWRRGTLPWNPYKIWWLCKQRASSTILTATSCYSNTYKTILCIAFTRIFLSKRIRYFKVTLHHSANLTMGKRSEGSDDHPLCLVASVFIPLSMVQLNWCLRAVLLQGKKKNFEWLTQLIWYGKHCFFKGRD